MAKEPRYLYEYVKIMDAFVCVPTPEQIRTEVSKGCWFLGGEFEREYDPSHVVRASTAIRRLKKRFGQPNTNLISPERDGVWKDKPKWGYLLLVDAEFWFSIYEADGKVRLGFRILANDDNEYLKRRDFDANETICEGFFQLVESILKRRNVK